MSVHKRARWGNRSPWQILADATATGLADDCELWLTWERASRGRRQLTWSTGDRDLRVWAGLGKEQSDVEAAAEELDGDVVVALPAETWRAVRARSWQVLDVAEVGGRAALVAWLDRQGLEWFDAHPSAPARAG